MVLSDPSARVSTHAVELTTHQHCHEIGREEGVLLTHEVRRRPNEELMAREGHGDVSDDLGAPLVEGIAKGVDHDGPLLSARVPLWVDESKAAVGAGFEAVVLHRASVHVSDYGVADVGAQRGIVLARRDVAQCHFTPWSTSLAAPGATHGLP